MTSASAGVDLTRVSLGLELGSTRIKAVLAAPDGTVLATGGHTWENERVDGVWTYSLGAVTRGIQAAYADLAGDLRARTGTTLTTVGSIGVSGMMHGYLPLDEDGNLLAAFRTWRNTFTQESSARLSRLFGLNIPQRWSVSHLHHAITHGEEHVARIAHLTTLAGYVHHRLTGRHVLGVGEASGVFPIGPDGRSFDPGMLADFDALDEVVSLPWRLADILPEVALAGQEAGFLTPEGALLLDPTRTLVPGPPLCPPEGDAGTGMVATNAVRPRTGNVSAGTSAFAMVVLDSPLRSLVEQIDLVATPDGAPVAMAHSNNCTSDLNAWVGVFSEFAQAIGAPVEKGRLYDILLGAAEAAPTEAAPTEAARTEAAPPAPGQTAPGQTAPVQAVPAGAAAARDADRPTDAASDGSARADRPAPVLAFNFLSGEHLVDVAEGRPMLVRHPDAELTLASLMRAHLFSAFASMAYGLRILRESADVPIDSMYAHGGIFATPGVPQRALAAAFATPVSVGASATEGGAWGMALLAGYLLDGAGACLADHLATRVFAGRDVITVVPTAVEVAEFARYLETFAAALPLARAAAAHI